MGKLASAAKITHVPWMYLSELPGPHRGRRQAAIDVHSDNCWGEGGMHGTAMLLGLLGGERYQGQVEIITPFFGSSGTGQINAVFPITPINPTAETQCPIS